MSSYPDYSSVIPTLFAHRKGPLRITGIRPQPDPLQTQGQGRRILVVDDETMIADSLAEILSEHGYDAQAFYEGSTAVESTQEKCPEIVICDVVMPRLDGVQTAIAIREVCPHARIILFSGQAALKDILKDARDQGHWFEVLAKPIHPDDLLRRLAEKRE
jgi:DNA-binding NtrC family response regulator